MRSRSGHGAQLTLALAVASLGHAQSLRAACSSTLTANYAAPSLAGGYVAHLIARNLTNPRGIKFDSNDALLVVEQGRGVSALNMDDAGNDCVSVRTQKLVIDEPSLNHGIELSPDGKTLYASSGDTLWSWNYSGSMQSNTSEPRPLVTGMAGSDHTSRTLKLSRWATGIMVINRGSNENVDPLASEISSGHGQVKAFNVSNATKAYDSNSDGVVLGWGLRNDVGIDEEPMTGKIYTVENSVDELEREGQDIHENNPAEELNFLGYLNGTRSPNQGRNFGYPGCFTAWYPEDVPDFDGAVGEQFAIGTPNATLNDTTCDSANRQAPRLSFQAHMAPLDILFNDIGTAAWITFHGSWNRDSPVGYDLRVVEFEQGGPVAPSTSRDAAVPIMRNTNLSACPERCFRPVGLAWDSKGRLFMSSDSSGEVYMIVRTDGRPTSMAGSNATGTIPGITNDTTSGTASSSPASSRLVSATGSLRVCTAMLCLALLSVML